MPRAPAAAKVYPDPRDRPTSVLGRAADNGWSSAPRSGSPKRGAALQPGTSRAPSAFAESSACRAPRGSRAGRCTITTWRSGTARHMSVVRPDALDLTDHRAAPCTPPAPREIVSERVQCLQIGWRDRRRGRGAAVDDDGAERGDASRVPLTTVALGRTAAIPEIGPPRMKVLPTPTMARGGPTR